MGILESKNIHFIGIGGIGVSALANIFLGMGKNISGSDISSSDILDDLSINAKIFKGHDPNNIPVGTEYVVYSPAIVDTNPEYLEAKKRGLNAISYPEALGQLTKKYKTIAISGTHGKSTTTGFVSKILVDAGLDPTIIIGTKMPDLGNKNYRLGKSEYLIIEACEYKDSFLHFEPNILIITNLEQDHLDYFSDFNHYKSTFAKLAEKLGPQDLIIAKNSSEIAEVIDKSKAKKILWNSGDPENCQIEPMIIGEFNKENATHAAITGLEIGIKPAAIEESIKAFTGTWRRMEHKITKYSDKIFIDDYAHHPTAIRKTLQAIRDRYSDKRILCVFQPHQHSRTRLLLNDFATAFNQANEVLIPNIYAVRDTEEEMAKISSEDLVKQIAKNNANVKYLQTLEKTAEYINKNIENYDIVVTMGAGDISGIYKFF